jgi:hypothetical protein
MIYGNRRLPASLLTTLPARSSQPSTQQQKQPANNPTRKTEPLPPLKIQVFEVLRQNGFGFTEAHQLAGEVIAQFNATQQRIFAFGPVAFHIDAGLRTKLITAPLGYETLDRVLERIETQQHIEFDRRVREIREKRERDERRRPW